MGSDAVCGAETSPEKAADMDAEASEASNERMIDAYRRAAVAHKNYAKLRSVCVGARQVCSTPSVITFQMVV